MEKHTKKDKTGETHTVEKGSFEDLLQESLSARRTIVLGEKMEAKVFGIGKEYVFLDLGAREEGLLPRTEVEQDGELSLKVGDSLTVLPLHFRDGAVICGRRLGAGLGGLASGDKDAALASLRDALDNGLPVEGTVKEVNKGGFTVQVMNLRAFCPISHIDDAFCDDPSVHVGRTYSFLIQELDGTGRNLVVSRRKLLQQEAEEQASLLWDKLEVGGVYEGVVKSIMSYGAFVDLGGIEGLLHVSEIEHERIENPESVLEKGQKVRVVLQAIDYDKKRLSLSRKALLEDPWLEASREIVEGQVYTGRVIRLAQFGAFVELRKGVEGLVHISEMGQGKRLHSPREAVKVGEEVRVRVVAVDAERRRIGLSLNDTDRSDETQESSSPSRAGGDASHRNEAAPRPPKSLGTFGDLFAKKLNQK